MVETKRDNGESRKVCCGDPEEIQNNGLGIHDYADFGDTTSRRVDANLYMQMIGSMPDICFTVNTLC